MTGIDDVANGSIDWFHARSRSPTIVYHLYDSTQRTFRDDTLLLILQLVEKQRLIAIPSSQSTQAVCIANPKTVISRTSSQLLFGWIELGVLDHQSLVDFSIKVDGLSIVEIDSHRHQVALETYTMGMNEVKTVLGFLVKGEASQVDVLLILCQLLVLARHNEFGKGASGISRLFAFGKQLNGIDFCFLLAKICEETEFIVGTITVGIIQLGWYLLTINRDHCPIHLAILSDVQHYRFVTSLHLGGIGDLHLKSRLGIQATCHKDSPQ